MPAEYPTPAPVETDPVAGPALAAKQDAATAATDAELAAVKAGAKGVVVHGADPNVARPAGFASVEWVGTVAPSNALDGDNWLNTS